MASNLRAAVCLQRPICQGVGCQLHPTHQVAGRKFISAPNWAAHVKGPSQTNFITSCPFSQPPLEPLGLQLRDRPNLPLLRVSLARFQLTWPPFVAAGVPIILQHGTSASWSCSSLPLQGLICHRLFLAVRSRSNPWPDFKAHSADARPLRTLGV